MKMFASLFAMLSLVLLTGCESPAQKKADADKKAVQAEANAEKDALDTEAKMQKDADAGAKKIEKDEAKADKALQKAGTVDADETPEDVK